MNVHFIQIALNLTAGMMHRAAYTYIYENLWSIYYTASFSYRPFSTEVPTSFIIIMQTKAMVSTMLFSFWKTNR